MLLARAPYLLLGGGIASERELPLFALGGNPLGAAEGATVRGGVNRFGGMFKPVTNEAGGEAILCEGSIEQSDFGSYVNSGLMKGNQVNILSGAHGTEEGVMTAEPAFFNADQEAFGGLEGVTVHDAMSLSPQQMSGMLNAPNTTTIGAFCNSGVCLGSLVKKVGQ